MYKEFLEKQRKRYDEYLKQGTKVRIKGAGQPLNDRTGEIVGVTNLVKPINYIIKPDQSIYDDDIYPYDFFVMPDVCLEVIEEKITKEVSEAEQVFNQFKIEYKKYKCSECGYENRRAYNLCNGCHKSTLWYGIGFEYENDLNRKLNKEHSNNFWNSCAITVDCVIFAEDDNSVVLIKRKNDPFKGQYALPGGFVEENESITDACVREVFEETNLKLDGFEFVGVYSKPDRDPRGRVISFAFIGFVDDFSKLKAKDDAIEVEIVTEKVWNSAELAFDHKKIIHDAERCGGGEHSFNF